MLQERDGVAIFARGLSSERRRLVALCAQLSGCVDVAEDLAQETLVEAWRHVGVLRDDAGRTAWLTAIARNVCRRWARAYSRDIGYRRAREDGDAPDAVSLLAAQAADVDVELELERIELVALLGRALAVLPPSTRSALLERYVDESPIADIAMRLKLSEGAVSKRIERGKGTLRRVLKTDLREDAARHGLPVTDGWQETRLWCPVCGRRRLQGCLHPSDGPVFALRCPGCCAEPGSYIAHTTGLRQVVAGVKGYTPALTRLELWEQSYYRHALARGTMPCEHCRRALPVRREVPAEVFLPPSLRGAYGVSIRCVVCEATRWTTLGSLALGLPEGRRFWRAHPRIRTLPEREVEVDGCPALVTRFESVTGAAALDVVSARETYAVLGFYGAPADEPHGHAPSQL